MDCFVCQVDDKSESYGFKEVSHQIEGSVWNTTDFNTPRIGQRKLRTQTIVQPNIQNLQAINAIGVPGNEDLNQILAKYGNNSDGIPALLSAIKSNDAHAVKLLLENGASPNTRFHQAHGEFQYDYTNRPSNAIEYAAAYSSSEVVALLETYGAKLGDIFEFRNDWRQNVLIQSPVSIAAAFDNLEVFRYLVSKEPNICDDHEIIDLNCSPPIFIAAMNDSIKIFKELIALGVDISSMKDGLLSTASEKGSKVQEYLLENFGPFSTTALNSALYQATARANLKLINLLLKNGANPSPMCLNEADAWSLIFSMSAQHYPKKDEIIELFISSGVDVNKPIQGLKPIDKATMSGEISTVKLLVKYGAQLNSQYTPNTLQNSYVYRFPEIVKFLIDSGVPVNKAYDGGMTPLHFASQCYDPNTAASIDLLIAAGANINAVTREGQTPLHLATSESVILKLIQNNANIHALNSNKCKPYYQSQSLNLETIKAYVKAGANFNDMVGGYRPVFHFFIWRNDSKEVLEFFMEANKIDINAKNSIGRTVFHEAVQSGKFDLMEFLIKNKADINARDNQGQTPLAIAKQYHQELVPWLMDHGANWIPV